MLQVLLNGIIVGGIYALMTVGFNLIFASVRFYHLAYGALGLFGAYFTRFFQLQFDLHFVVSMALSAAIFGFVGVFIWRVVYMPLKKRGASSIGMIVAAFGLMIVLQNLISLIFSPSTKSISATRTVVEGLDVFGLKITINQVIILAVAVILMIAMEILLNRTKLGAGIRAVGQNKDLAKISGIPAERVIIYTFYIGTFLSVIGASLNALEIGLKPTMGLIIILKVVIAAVIGGMGSIRGALAGGLLLGVAENLGIFYLGGQWQDTVAFTILILFLMFKPEGMFSTLSSRKV